MKSDKETYLSKLNFEAKSYLLSLYESINKNPLESHPKNNGFKKVK